MKAKIFVMLFAVMLVAGSISFAGDQKPFKGWVQQVDTRLMTEAEARTYEFLDGVINSHDPDLLYGMFFTIYKGVNNVGGASVHENAQIFYFKPDFSGIEIYEASTITVANGDQIFLTVEGIATSPQVWTTTDTVVGGTGRFEGAIGSIPVRPGFDSHFEDIIIFDGYVTTVGKAKKQ